MNESASDRNPVEALAEEFVARYRRGERPPLTEYTDKHPELAEEIRDVFPALLMMEDVRPKSDEVTGAYGPEDPLIEGKKLERVGDYRILREVGRGGMGIVYEAEQESLGRHVALKVLPAHSLLDPQRLRRFQREAMAAARLHHTNIVPVFGVGEDEGLHYYVMQFIQGQGLDEVLVELKRLRQAKSGLQREISGSQISTLQSERASEIAQGLLTGQFELGAKEDGGRSSPPSLLGKGAGGLGLEPISLPPPPLRVEGSADRASSLSDSGIHLPGQAAHSTLSDSGRQYCQSIARIGIQVAEALTYAHNQGTLHRDIKPSNLILDTQGTVWITDFGLAKAVESDDLTRTGDIVGTIRYMAPERFQGKSDARSDVYGLGLTLYELLTLRPAFDESDRVRLVQRVTQLEPPPPRRLDRRIPRDLETIVLTAINKEPEKRYQSAAALAADLRSFAEDKPIRARRVSAPERLWRWSRRNRALAWLTGSVAASLLAVAVVSTLSAVWLKGQRDRAEEAEQQGRLELGKSLRAQGTANQRTGLAGQRFDSLDLLGRAAAVLRSYPQAEEYLPEVRDQAITALGLTDLRVDDRPRRIGAVTMGICCDARLERYAVFELRSADLVVRRMEDDRELFRLSRPKVPFWYAHPIFSPDGQYLAAGYYAPGGPETLLQVWRLPHEAPIFSQQTRCKDWAFHPDGRRLLFCPADGGLGIWDLQAGREVKRLPLGLTTPYCMCLASDGRRIAVNNDPDSGPALVKLLDLVTERELASWTSQVGNTAMAWSADGLLLATGSTDDGRVYVWDVPRGQLASVLQGHTGRVTGCQFAHAGHLLATNSWDGTTRLWDAASGEALASAPGQLAGPFSADDRRLPFYLNANLGVWEVAHGQECRTLHPGMIGNRIEKPGWSGQVNGTDFSPDGRLLAVADSDGVRLYDTATGLELAHLPVGRCDTVLFHPDGQSLITYGQKGLYRWPIRLDAPGSESARLVVPPLGGKEEPPKGGTTSAASPVRRFADSQTWRVGPPDLLRTGLKQWEDFRAAWMPGYNALAAIDNDNGRVLLIDLAHPQSGGSQSAVLPSEHRRMTSIAVSPDGRWAAAGGWKRRGIQVWNVPERRLERVLAPSDGAGDSEFAVAFSPDGRWLVSRTNNYEAGGYYFWRVDTWERGLVIPCPPLPHLAAPAFTRDGRFMALILSPQQIRLADAATGRLIANLSTLQPLNATPLAFSADGTRLAASTNQRSVLLWDLRAIRRELDEMRLDWDQPPYPPAEKVKTSEVSETSEVSIQIDLGDLTAREKYSLILAFFPLHADAYYQRGLAYSRFEQWNEARSDFSMTLALKPDQAAAHYHRGLIYARDGRQPEAVADFSRAIELQPTNGEAYLARGQAHLNLQHWPEAVADLSKFLEHPSPSPSPTRGGEGGEVKARHLRATAYTRLQNWDQALADLDRAIELDAGYVQAWTDRAEVYIRDGQWEKAAVDYAQLTKLDPNNHWYWYRRAPLSLLFGQTQEYRQICREMLARFANKAEWPERVAKTCLLAPQAVSDLRPVLKLADQTVTGTEQSRYYRWFVLVKGLAEYRAGRYASTVDWLKRFSPEADGVHFDATVFAVLAMAQYRLGQVEAARTALCHAKSILSEKMPDPRAGRPFGPGWPNSVWDFHDWLHAQILCREAEALLGTKEEITHHKDTKDTKAKR